LGDIPEPLIERRTDPCIVRHTDGYYYFTASVPQYDRIELRRAKTIAGLVSAQTRDVWRKSNFGAASEQIRAPELHHSQGAWYLYFAAAGHRTYVLRNESPNPLEGVWEFKGPVETDGVCRDATTFSHKGLQYYLWTDARICLAPMKTPWELAAAPITLGEAAGEGVSVLKRRGRIYISHAAELLWTEEGADLLDPQAWQSGVGIAPSHSGFTVAEDGATVLLVYHARPYTESASERHTFIQPLRWDDRGMPSIE
jgi:GH43 family beta-xylosidase